MNKIEKLFRKISKKDRLALRDLIEKISNWKTENLGSKKLVDSDFYRIRKGKFRTIFHYEKKTAIIDSIKLCNEKRNKFEGIKTILFD